MKNLLSFFWIVAVVIFTILTLRLFYLFQANEIEAMMGLLVPYTVVTSAILASTSIFLSVDNANMLEVERKQIEKEKNRVILSAFLDTIFIKAHTIKGSLNKIDIEALEDNEDQQSNLFKNEYKEICSKLSFAFSNMAQTIDKLYDKEVYYSLDSQTQQTLNTIIANTITLLEYKEDILSIGSQTENQANMFYTKLVKVQEVYQGYEEVGILLLKKLDAQNSVFLNRQNEV